MSSIGAVTSKIKYCFALSAVCLGLSGCAGTGSSRSYGNADSELVSDSGSFFSTSGAAACAGTAVLGALIGALSCKDNRAACAIGGAVGGCALGMTANYTLDSIRANYHNTEQRLGAVAEAVRADNQKLSSLTAASKKILRRDQAEVARLEKQIRAGRADREQLRAQAEKMDDNIAALRTNLDNLNERLYEHKNMRNDLLKAEAGGRISNLNSSSRQTIKELDRDIASMQSKIDDLQKTYDQYWTLKDKLYLGG